MTVTLDGSPIEGVTVTGITTEDGSPCVTNSEGKTSGVTGVDTVTIATSTGYVDINEASQIVETGGALSTDATLEITSINSGEIKVTSSKQISFSPSRTSVTYFICGGGAGGTACKPSNINSTTKYYVSGSGGGYTKTGTINPGGEPISIMIGTGGSGGSTTGYNTQTGGSGGSTQISGKFGVESVGGGNGGGSQSDNNGRNAVQCNGGNGGSGGGGCAYLYNPNSSMYEFSTGNGGKNGSNGFSSGNNLTTTQNRTTGGTGQGTSTAFDGTTYASGAGSVIFGNTGMFQQGFPGYGSGQNMVTDQDNTTAGSGTVAGCAGGNMCSYATTNGLVSGGKGANGIAIFSW